MADRYLAVIGVSADQRERIVRKIRGDPGWRIAVDRLGLLVVTAAGSTPIPLPGGGLILGRLHRTGRRGALRSLAPDCATEIVAGRGEALVREHWGDYIALLAGPEGAIDILRAPFGALPCFTAWSDQGWIAGSDVASMTQLGSYRASIDGDALWRFALAPDVRMAATCLTGLFELRGGDRLSLTAKNALSSTLWNPWTFADRAQQINDPEDAKRRLRETIVSSMDSSLAGVDRSVILLSGGLDSSIVAASAVGLGHDARCVTVSTRVASGDERPFARQTSEAVGLPLSEAWFDLAGVDLARSDAARLPRPTARAFEQEGRRQARLVAQSVGADAMLSGGGGDNVFCALQSVAPAVDCLSERAGRGAFRRTTRELSRMTGASVATIVRRAILRAWRPGRPYPIPRDARFLDPARMAPIEATTVRHPWLRRPAGIAQGKGAHVAALLGVQCLTEDSDPQDALTLRYPLLAQPIVELCLRIPTWLWYDRDCNRAVARHAYSGNLPPEIAWRRSKGTPDGFVVELYDARRAQIRAMLCDGFLAAHGMLDLPRLARVLDDPRPVRGTDHGRIMRLIDIEAWCRTWAG